MKISTESLRTVIAEIEATQSDIDNFEDEQDYTPKDIALGLLDVQLMIARVGYAICERLDRLASGATASTDDGEECLFCGGTGRKLGNPETSATPGEPATP